MVLGGHIGCSFKNLIVCLTRWCLMSFQPAVALMVLENIRARLATPYGEAQGTRYSCRTWDTWMPSLLCVYLVPVLEGSLFCFQPGLSGNVPRSTGHARASPRACWQCVVHMYVCTHVG